MPRMPPEQKRKGLIAKIHVAKQQLNMEDDMYRNLLQELTDCRSCKQMNHAQLETVLRQLCRLGFVPQKQISERKPLHFAQHGAMMRKISVLLTQTGKSWNYAHGIAKRMFGKDTVQQCDSEQMHSIVAALNYHAKRQG